METRDQKFLSVLKGLMRPLVRTLIARGVTAPAFYKLLKTVYVDVAHESFRIDYAPPTDSRITLLTGVHRRDVRAILSGDVDDWTNTQAKSAMFATVLGQWLARPEYQNSDGTPLALPRTSDDGLSFEALVASINTDIRPRTVLDELMRQQLVVESDEGLLVISPDARRGPASDEDKLVFFAANVGDHIAAASENLLSDTPPFFERAVFFNHLTPGAVDQIENSARTLSQDVLEKLNAESQALRSSASSADGAYERYRLGIYFFREKTEPTAAPSKEDRDDED